MSLLPHQVSKQQQRSRWTCRRCDILPRYLRRKRVSQTGITVQRTRCRVLLFVCLFVLHIAIILLSCCSTASFILSNKTLPLLHLPQQTQRNPTYTFTSGHNQNVGLCCTGKSDLSRGRCLSAQRSRLHKESALQSGGFVGRILTDVEPDQMACTSETEEKLETEG